MTNAEKFEEVFGMKISKCAADPCNMVSRDSYSKCIHNDCFGCELSNFWDRDYIKTGEDREDVSKVFALGTLFEVLSMIDKELKNKEDKNND